MPDRIVNPLMASLFLGLAPFMPEPHLVQKFRWMSEGHPFKLIDIFDVLMHGAPWVWLLVALILTARDAFSKRANARAEVNEQG